MNGRLSTRFLAAVLATGFMMAGLSAQGADESQGGWMGYGPGMMGPGTMSNWTPEQRRQHWVQMRRLGYGPGMMGYGPGMMSGPRPQGAQTESPGR